MEPTLMLTAPAASYLRKRAGRFAAGARAVHREDLFFEAIAAMIDGRAYLGCT